VRLGAPAGPATADGPHAVRLASAGAAIVGVTFGMARYGYGLLLPDIRRDYGLGPGALGAIGTGAYVAYLGTGAAAGVYGGRLGPRRTAVLAGLLAALGMAIAGLSRSPAWLLLGIVVGGAGAGFAFPPFSDAARPLEPVTRRRVIAAISCGTGYGVAVAAPVAILAGDAWRTTWLACAALALLASAWAARVLRGAGAGVRAGAEPAPLAAAWQALHDRRAAPMLAGAVLVGLGSSAFWTFAIEHLVDAGALSPAATRGFLGVVGVASLLATLAGDLVHRLGARRAYATTALAEALALALLALAPGSPPAALVSAILFGAAYNAVLAVQGIWSAQLFDARPSLGLSAALTGNGLGLLLGQLGAGLLAGPLGLAAVLLLGAGLVAMAGLCAPPPTMLPRAGSRRPR
jgi:predicted MFS family arabinose efflux permease